MIVTKVTPSYSDSYMNEPLKVYLDQKDWINLSRAFYDRPDGTGYQSVLNKIRSASRTSQMIFPLSSAHIIETMKSTNVDRRKRLAYVMAEISRGWTIAPTYEVGQSELRIQIAKLFGIKPPRHREVFRLGVPFAFGRVPILRDRDQNILPLSEDLMKRYMGLISNSETIQMFLVGHDEVSVHTGIEHFRESQDTFMHRVDDFRQRAKPYGSETHKRAYVATLTVNLQDDLTNMLAKYGRSFSDFMNIGRDKLMSFFADVPVLDVETELLIFERSMSLPYNSKELKTRDLTLLMVRHSFVKTQ